jgi:glucokinase-like ROK family protein
MGATADHILVRKHNTALVLDYLRRNASISRAEVAGGTGLNRSTVSSIVNELIDENYVIETTYQSDRIGRPGLQLELNPDGGFAVGLEIGVDFLSLIISDFAGNVRWRYAEKSQPGKPREEILENAFNLVDKALEEGKVQGMRPLGIGIGVPGLIDVTHGIVKLAPNLGWRDVPLYKLWAERYNLPVYVENEANAAAMAEYYFGVARGIETFVYINAGVGLGSGIVVDGKLFRGSFGYAAEIGHMTYDPEGEICNCGRRGCYETVIGPRAVVKKVREKISQKSHSILLQSVGNDLDKITFEAVADSAMEGDEVCIAALKDVGFNLGILISSVVNVINPNMVILGGVLNYASKILVPIVKEVVQSYTLELSLQGLIFVESEFGTESCVIGATALVLDSIWREPGFTS